MKPYIAILLFVLCAAVLGCSSPTPPPIRLTSMQTPSPDKASNRSAMGCTYTVRRGDSLSKIAHKVYGDATLWRRILDANNLPSVNVEVGQILIMPMGHDASTETSRIATPIASQESYSIGELVISADSVAVSTNGLITAKGTASIQSDEETITADIITVAPEPDGGVFATATGNVTVKNMKPTGMLSIFRSPSMKRRYRPKKPTKQQETPNVSQ
jgi:LysM repeat protein